MWVRRSNHEVHPVIRPDKTLPPPCYGIQLGLAIDFCYLIARDNTRDYKREAEANLTGDGINPTSLHTRIVV
jgi:hypothetical protein